MRDMYKFFLKRLLDFVLSLLALLILFPLLVVLGILVRVFLGTPVLFIQQRPGVNEKIFRLYKFRSMTDRKDTEGKLLPDEERLTRFGRFLRASSLDELPELINILKGDSGIVGPGLFWCNTWIGITVFRNADTRFVQVLPV